MKPNRHLNRSLAVAVALLLGTAQCLAADPIADSFDRMLAHQPGPAMPITGADRAADPLLNAMMMPLRDGSPRLIAVTTDPVADSFARMLGHTPGSYTPTVPANLGADPLVAAMVEPLRQWLAESAATTRFASAPGVSLQH